jgi:hypothetical protein
MIAFRHLCAPNQADRGVQWRHRRRRRDRVCRSGEGAWLSPWLRVAVAVATRAFPALKRAASSARTERAGWLYR